MNQISYAIAKDLILVGGICSAILTCFYFFNWLPDVSQVTVRARFLPWRVMPFIGIHPSGGTPDGHE